MNINVNVAGTANTLFNVAKAAGDFLSNVTDETSLIESTSVARNEPYVIVEDSLVHMDITPNLLKLLTNLYMGYYLQAVALDNNVGGVNILNKLDKLNAKRNSKTNEFITKRLNQSFESFVGIGPFDKYHTFPKGGSPTLSTESLNMCYPVLRPVNPSNNVSTSFEASIAFGKTDDLTQEEQAIVDAINQAYAGDPSGAMKQKIELDKIINSNKAEELRSAREITKLMSSVQADGLKTINDAPNLAVGKHFQVIIENEGKQASIPVLVRLHTLNVSRFLMTQILSLGDMRDTAKERWNRFKEGELSVWDLLFCNDLIEKEYKTLGHDKHGVYREIEKRRRDNKIANYISGQKGLATASSMAIISEQTANELHLILGGSLSNSKIRSHVFARCSLMFLVVVDSSMQYVTIYHRGIDLPMEHMFSEINRLGKSDGPNPLDLLRSFQAGQRPNI